MGDVSVSIPAEQYDRLTALAAARGVSVEAQLIRLIDDACEGGGPPGIDAEKLPLGVCDEESDAK